MDNQRQFVSIVLTVSVMAGVILFSDCSGSGGGSPPSCKAVPTPCSALSFNESLCASAPECERKFSCAGTAVCSAALTSNDTRFPDLNFEGSSPGCYGQARTVSVRRCRARTLYISRTRADAKMSAAR
jgi:hypothetical protein